MSDSNSASMPPQDDLRAQYVAAKTDSAVFDLGGRTHIELTGSDRAKFLHNFCTNDVRGLSPGWGCEAFITSVQGKVLADVFVFAEADALWIESGPGAAERIIAHLSKYQISEDVIFTDRTEALHTLYVAGPRSNAVLQHVGIAPPGKNLQHHQATLADGAVRVRRNDFLHLPGDMLVASPDALAACSASLLRAGAIAAGPAVFKVLRIEAGFPEYGVDMTDANLAQEVNRTAQAISFTKGCYLGQEPIARIDALGHVNQQLRVLRLQAGPVPEPGSEIVASETDPKPIGRVTSAALSFENNLPVALAYLRRGHDKAETSVAVRVGDKYVAARIVS